MVKQAPDVMKYQPEVKLIMAFIWPQQLQCRTKKSTDSTYYKLAIYITPWVNVTL